MGVKLNYIPMVTNSLMLNPFTPRAARHDERQLYDCDFIAHCNRVAILYVFSRAEQNIVSVIELAIVLVI